jgi:membrane protein implicated in regulation of membrane protease activity
MRYSGPAIDEGDARVSLWFWGWLIASAAIALASWLARDRASWPFAVGAACAAAFEAFGLPPAAQWLAFAGLGSAVFVVANRRRYVPRHGREARRHSGRTREDAN